MDNLRIYVHVPFCSQRCAYCDFVTYDDKSYLIDSYFKAAEREVALYLPDLKKGALKSIFFGGGTPTFPDASYLAGLVRKFNPKAGAEISLEANPGTVNREKLQLYREAGFNRISFGVQSFDNDVLTVMGRIHDKTTAIRNIREAFAAGFQNVSIDLIFGYPLQTKEKFRNSIQTAIELGVKHLSCYSLKVSEGTPLEDMIRNRLLPEPDDELDREMYWMAVEVLKKAGFDHYEISNFAYPGYECNHNIGYWKLDDYIGIGAGAHSYFKNERYSNTENIAEYIKRLGQYEFPVAESTVIDEKESMKEFVILGLRMIEGVSLVDFRERYGVELKVVFGNQILSSISDGLLSNNGKYIKLSPKGLDFANQVMRKFM